MRLGKAVAIVLLGMGAIFFVVRAFYGAPIGNTLVGIGLLVFALVVWRN
jgi:hypothetical protein